MWESIKALIFDPAQPHGLNTEFLQNMMAEGAGTVIGIIISVMIALRLDRAREQSAHRDQRGRAVTRWVKNHADMSDNLRESFHQGDDQDIIVYRAMVVDNAARDARDIRDDYPSAMNARVIGEPFEEYVRSLNALSLGLGDSNVDHDIIEERFRITTENLKALVQAAGARRAILQTEPIFGNIRLKKPLYDPETDDLEKTASTAAVMMRQETPKKRAFR